MIGRDELLFAALATVFIILVAAALVVLVRQRKPEARRATPYVEGLKALIDGRRDDAQRNLEQAVRSGAAPPDGYIRLGELMRVRGEANKALQIHKNLTVHTELTSAEHVDLSINIAEDYAALGQPKQAIETLQQAIKKRGVRAPAAFFVLARELDRTGDIDGAYDQLRDLKKLGATGDHQIASYLAAAARRKLGEDKTSEAKKLLQRALKHDENSADALLVLGNFEDAQGHSEAAATHWRQAAKLSPDVSRIALSHLERVLFQSGRFGDVGEVYRDILEARPDDEYATLSLASFYRKQGREDDALQLLEEFRSGKPDSVGATMLLTSIYANREDRSAVEKFAEEFAPSGTGELSNFDFESLRPAVGV